jgi:putative oxidoreductase
MIIVVTIARVLLGLIFVFFGSNPFLHFLPMPPLAGISGTFLGVLISSHYVLFVGGVQLIAGVLLLINQFVPLALALLAAVIANIMVYHLTMDLPGIGLAVLVMILWCIVAWSYRAYFEPLFARKAIPSGTSVDRARTDRATI